MILDIKSLKILVDLQYLPNLIKHSLLTEESYASRIKILIKFLLFSRLANNKSKKLFQSYLGRVKNLSWLKYESDGTRIHLYDHKNQTIGKLPKKFNQQQYTDEIEARKRVGDLSPGIIYTSSEDGFILEDKISLSPFSKSLSEALEMLQDRLFIPSLISTRKYFSRFNHIKHSNIVTQIAEDHGINELIITICHGDFWRGNILEDSEGSIIILDWEYCGERVQSYDAWFLIFSEWASKKKHCTDNYYLQFHEILVNLYKDLFDLEKTKILHMIHLFERFATHQSFGKSLIEPEMQFLEEELILISEELSL